MKTGSPGTLIGWKSGQTTFVPLWDWMEGAWLRTQVLQSKHYIFKPPCIFSGKGKLYSVLTLKFFNAVWSARTTKYIYKSTTVSVSASELGPPPPLPQACPHHRNQGDSLACWRGGPNSDDWRKCLALSLFCGQDPQSTYIYRVPGCTVCPLAGIGTFPPPL